MNKGAILDASIIIDLGKSLSLLQKLTSHCKIPIKIVLDHIRNKERNSFFLHQLQVHKAVEYVEYTS